MKTFITDYVQSNAHKWSVTPKVIDEVDLQDCIILEFGNPKVAAFAHMDTTGFMVRYQDQLVPIGSPEVFGGELLVGKDHLGEISCKLQLDEDRHATYVFGRGIATGTCLVFRNEYQETESHVTAAYLDNRAGIMNLLKVAENLKDGALVFSCWEEHGGGAVPFLVKYLYEKHQISKMLVSDVTWITEGVKAGDGVVISYRDQRIPRQSFVRQILQKAAVMQISHQVEVEAHGASDGREIQSSPYPIDWCFIGAPVQHIHSNHERIQKSDLESMIALYKGLMPSL